MYSYWFCIGKGYRKDDIYRPVTFATIVEIPTKISGTIVTPANAFDECVTKIMDKYGYTKVLITTFDRKI